ncbi:hypothetical protein Syun_004055 [Stephania yunnanensis]|uniref:Uncharacterized protein n=1 Tax=Stephania yunnanensis TaxID=152371 RepID=A0AAP0L2A8_9MAGN
MEVLLKKLYVRRMATDLGITRIYVSVMGTSFWLFFPQLVRNKADLRGLEEYRIVPQWLNDQVVQLI